MKFINNRINLDILHNPNATLDEIRGALVEMCVYETDLKVYEKFLEKTNLNFIINNATPLTVAVIHNNLKIVKFLVERGADVMATDGTDTLPYEYAVLGDRKDIENFLFYPTLVEMTKIKNNDIEKYNKMKEDLLEKRKDFLRGYSEED